jgi:hypothetical protein
MLSNDRSWSFTIRPSILLYVTVCWSFCVRGAVLPFALPPAVGVLIWPVAGCALYYVYRNLGFSVSLSPRDVLVLASYMAAFVLLNRPILFGEAITGDELVHAEHAMISIEAIRAYVAPTATLWSSVLPKELNYYFATGMLVCLSVIAILWRRIGEERRPRAFYSFLAILLLALGLLALKFADRLEPHPPMRLLPLFLGHMIFGLTDVSFRLPGVFCAAIVSFAAYRLVLRKDPTAGLFAYCIGFSLYMIPTVFHSAVIVEPSIWGFGVWTLCIFAIYLACDTDDVRYLIAAGVIVGAGSLMRQNVIVLWPIVGLVLLVHAPFRKGFVKNAFYVLLPAVLILPYLYTTKHMGHAATSGGVGEMIQNISKSLSSGIGPRAILKSSAPLWLIPSTLGMIYVCIFARHKVCLVYLAIFPAYCLYFSITPILWGLGRYQVEFIAPLVVLTLLLLALHVPRGTRALLVCVLLFLSVYTVHAHRTMHQDVQYGHWSKKRLTSESYYPYKEALEYLKRQESGGRFVMLAGVGVSSRRHGELVLWLRDFTFKEAHTFETVQEAFIKSTHDNPNMTVNDFLAYLQKNDVDYFLVQYGDKREFQHRWQGLHMLFYQLAYYERAARSQNLPFARHHTFVGRHEAAIDIFGPVNRKYGAYPPLEQRKTN